MDLFKNRIQPLIVHLGYQEGLPISNTYFLNYNVVQIDWVSNNSIVMEDGSGVLVLEDTNESNPFSSLAQDLNDVALDGELNNQKVLDIPRIFFTINDKFINKEGKIVTPNAINSFITALLSLSDNCVEHTEFDSTIGYLADLIVKGDTYDGIQLIPGQDFFINEAFLNYLITTDLQIEYPDLLDETSYQYKVVEQLKAITLPNFLDVYANIQEPWIALTESEENNTDLQSYYDTNVFSTITESYDIKQFYNSFCGIILDSTTIDILVDDFTNIKYKLILEYFRNGMKDTASMAIQLILGSAYTNSTIQSTSQLCNCGSSGVSEFSSCSSLYNKAMLEQLKQMLGDANFYNNWFYTITEEGKKPNLTIVKSLQVLIKSLLDSNYDLSFVEASKFGCSCSNNSPSSSANKDIITKYNFVLKYVENCILGNNINRTKLYGSQFGELLPKLKF